MNNAILGVDLGTTNTCVAIYTPEGAQVIDTERQGQTTFPSVVRIVDRNLDGDIIVGSLAKKFLLMKPLEVFGSVKTLMQDESWRSDSALVDKFTFGDTAITPSDIAEKILLQALDYAQDSKYGEDGPFDKVVICIPANSTPYYKDCLKAIAKKVGFGVKDENGEYVLQENGDIEGIYLLAEPTAAALCYAKEKGICDSERPKDQNLLIYDFGGGTFDVTILKVKTDGKRASEFDILGTYGVEKLGGDDIDKALMRHVSEKFYDETDIDLMDPSKDNKGNSPRAIYQAQSWLKEEAERAKIEFANGVAEYVFDYPGIIDDNDADRPCNLECVVTAGQFREIIDDILGQTVSCVQGALEASGLTVDDIDRFITVGGSSKGPWVAEILERVFGRKPYMADNVDTIVARGASFYGHECATGITATSTSGSESESGSDPNAPSDEPGPDGGLVIKTKTTHFIGVELSNGFFSPLVQKGMDTPSTVTSHYSNAHEAAFITVPVWATNRNLEVETLGGGASVVYEPVHGSDERGNPLFQHWGEMKVPVPMAPANTLDIAISITCEQDNSINVTTVIDGGEPRKISITPSKL